MTEKAKNGQILLENPICIMWYSRDAPGLANKILHPVKASRLPHTPPQWFDCDARAFEQFFPVQGYKNLSLLLGATSAEKTALFQPTRALPPKRPCLSLPGPSHPGLV